MFHQSFHQGRKSSVSQEQQAPTALAYDKDLKYNQVIETRDNDPTTAVRSFDAPAILRALASEDGLASLYKMTLGGRAVRGGVGVWDVLFNNTNKSVTACVLTATNRYTPIARERVIHSQSFLNYDMSISRIYFNQIQQGDRIGVAINDIMKGMVYVLLYIVDEACSVLSTQRDADDRSWMIPSLNLRMEHAVQVNYHSEEEDDNAIFVDMEEGNDYPEALANPFLQRLVSNVYKIKEAFPWKPHFLPAQPKSYSREKLEKRIEGDLARAETIGYKDFENRCAQIYERARLRKGANSPVQRKPVGNQRGPQRRAGPSVPLPVVEVVNLADRYMVKFHQNDDPSNKPFVFNKSEIGTSEVAEYYLSGRDLIGSILEEVPEILVLNAEVFGPNAYVRYFSMNF